MELGWLETVGILNAAIALFVWANVVDRRPANPLRPRLWSPVIIMGGAAVVVLSMLAHVISLATGVPFRGGGL